MAQHIENSDRGLTINRSLAWTIVTSLVVAVFWGGSTVQGTRSSIESLTQAVIALDKDRKDGQAEAKGERAQIEGRVRSLENGATRQSAQYDSLSRSIDELKAAQNETNALLRQLMQRSAK